MVVEGLGERATIFEAELKGIEIALRENKREQRRERVTIASDSGAAVRAIQKACSAGRGRFAAEVGKVMIPPTPP